MTSPFMAPLPVQVFVDPTTNMLTVGQGSPPPATVTYNARTSAQIAAAPQATDIALGDGALFYATGVPEVLYRMKGDRSAFVGVGAVSGAGNMPRTPLPTYKVASTPPAISVGAANAATQITGSQYIPASRSTAFLFSGGPLSFPASGGPFIGAYSGGDSGAYGSIEFVLETTDSTGRFELNVPGNDAARFGRLMYRGIGDVAWTAVSVGPTYTVPADGNGYLVLVTMGAAGKWEFRLDGVSRFIGLRVTPGTSVKAAAPKPKPRLFVVGDTFTEPTIVDNSLTSSPADGWAAQLGLLTGLDVWTQGKGGSGYLAGVPFTSRFTLDLLPNIRPGDIVLVAGGINDASSAATAVGAAAATYFAQIVGAGAVLRVLAPFRASGVEVAGVSSQYALADAIKAACIAAGGKYIDILSLPLSPLVSSWAGTTVVATGNSSRLLVGDIPAAFKPGAIAIADQLFILGTGASRQVARATYVDAFNSGLNCWQLAFNGVTFANWPVGTPVFAYGASYQTGSGKQGTPANDGDSDIYTGSDGTHPTRAGHLNIASIVAPLFLQSFL